MARKSLKDILGKSLKVANEEHEEEDTTVTNEETETTEEGEGVADPETSTDEETGETTDGDETATEDESGDDTDTGGDDDGESEEDDDDVEYTEEVEDEIKDLGEDKETMTEVKRTVEVAVEAGNFNLPTARLARAILASNGFTPTADPATPAMEDHADKIDGYGQAVVSLLGDITSNIDARIKFLKRTGKKKN